MAQTHLKIPDSCAKELSPFHFTLNIAPHPGGVMRHTLVGLAPHPGGDYRNYGMGLHFHERENTSVEPEEIFLSLLPFS
jgi:hypothetical protein